MTFYIKKPRGVLHLQVLENCIIERLLCYRNLKNNILEITNCQYLVEDSSLDRAGHFILRLLACSNTSFRYKFVKSELKLLEERLNSYDKRDMKICLKRLLKHSRETFSLNENTSLRTIYSTFIRVFSFMLRDSYLKCIFGESSNILTIKVPFYFCLSMVANRKVDLCNGMVDVPCTLWKQLLLNLFESYLNLILKNMMYSDYIKNAMQNTKTVEVLNYVQNICVNPNPRNVLKGSIKLNVTNIMEEAKFFPLCMMNLNNVLHNTNRLAHNDRFDFSLFLKHAGMSLSDSLNLWEHFYSKEHSKCSSCSHSWQKDGKRYIYGTRHLYGLEGSRKNYNCRNCKYLQEKDLGIHDSGGCPFKKFGDDHLKHILNTRLSLKSEEVDIIMHARIKNPNLGCRLLFENVCRNNTNNLMDTNVIIQNPVDYYIRLKQTITNNKTF